MNRWKPILAAALIFTSGMVTAVCAYRLMPKSWRSGSEPHFAPGPIDGKFEVLRKMQRELNLTPQQAARVDAILRDGRSRTKQIWDGCQPQFREEMKQVRERIQAELSMEQRAKFDELLKLSRERRGSKGPPERTNNPPSEGAGAPPSH